MSFSDLGLAPELSRAVAESGYITPTPIQAQAIPAVLADRDVLAGAQTGTGKTAAFVLPILQKLGSSKGRAPRALVLTPTRELAAQVAESARTYGRHVNLRTEVVFGGVSINPQIDALRRGCDVLVATPGRLLDLAEQNALDLGDVSVFVLDEADRMLDMGFIPAIRRVIKRLPARRQNLMFSATYSDEIRQLASRILRAPAEIEVAPRNATADRVDQAAYRVSKDDKRHLLAHLIQEGDWHQVLVFTRTKHGANRLAQQLEARGITTAAIHGNKSQGARVRALADFKANKVTALVATEVAARGLDIKELPHVVNYELPNVPQDYVHRIGRTARAGGAGCAVSLVSPDEGSLLKDIERLLGKSVPVLPTPSFTVPPMQPRTGSAPERDGGQQGSRHDGSHHEHRRRAGTPPNGRHEPRRSSGTPSNGRHESRRGGTQPRPQHESRAGGPAPRQQTGSRHNGTQQGHHPQVAPRPQRRRDREPQGPGSQGNQGGPAGQSGGGFSRIG